VNNWGELKSAILTTLDAVQDTERQAMLPTWRTLAESDIFNSLRAGWMIRRSQALALSSRVTLPPSLIELVGVGFVNHSVTDTELAEFQATGSIAALVNDPGTPLEALGPEHVAEVSRYRTAPRGYLVEGHNLRLVPWQSENRPLLFRLTFYSRGKPIVEDEDTNEVLHHIPAAYYYGMLRHAAIYSGDAEGEQRWSAALVTAVERANAAAYGWQGTGIVSRRVRAA
jgi:hypothetical protein